MLTLYLRRVQGRSALEAGLAMVPLFAPLSILAPFAGRLTAKVGSRAPMAAGLVVSAIGVALLTTVGAHASFLALLPSLLLWGIGMGILTPAVVAAAARSASPPAERWRERREPPASWADSKPWRSPPRRSSPPPPRRASR